MMKTKNILQMVEHLLPGGAERMAVNISNILANKDCNVVLCPTRALGDLISEVQDNVKVNCIYKNNFLDIRAFYRLIKITKSNKINIIHAHSSSIIWACLLKIIFPKLKIIWHDHYGNRLTDPNNKIYKKLACNISGIIAVNSDLREWSIQNMKIKNKENIIHLNNFPVLKTAEIPQRNDSKIKIVLLSNLRVEKDHLTFVNALASIKKEKNIENIEVIFAGLYWENEYLSEIKNVIYSNSLEKNIIFLGSITNVSQLLNSCDIGVICSTFEGLPVSLLEYGLANLAVVVTNVGQCAEVVDYGKAGIVVPKSDPEQLAKVLIELINSQELRNKLGTNLKNRVTNVYGANNFINRYYELIYNL